MSPYLNATFIFPQNICHSHVLRIFKPIKRVLRSVLFTCAQAVDIQTLAFMYIKPEIVETLNPLSALYNQGMVQFLPVTAVVTTEVLDEGMDDIEEFDETDDGGSGTPSPL